MRIDVSLNERVLVHVDRTPERYLGPGRHRVRVPFWSDAKVERLDSDALMADLRAEALEHLGRRDTPEGRSVRWSPVAAAR